MGYIKFIFWSFGHTVLILWWHIYHKVTVGQRSCISADGQKARDRGGWNFIITFTKHIFNDLNFFVLSIFPNIFANSQYFYELDIIPLKHGILWYISNSNHFGKIYQGHQWFKYPTFHLKNESHETYVSTQIYLLPSDIYTVHWLSSNSTMKKMNILLKGILQ